MNSLRPWKSGIAAAAAFSLFYTACALAFVFFPDGTIRFFNAWFHGLDLTLLRPPGGRPLTFGQFLYGIFGAGLVSFVIATTFAGFYNSFGRAATGSRNRVPR